MKKISVIIPIYNSEDFLDKCIKSIINQSYSNIEIILVDDGSTDNSRNICEIYEKKDERVKFFSQKNKGVSIARNLGISKSKGEYIVFLDSDDWLDEKTCEIALNEADKNKYDVVMWTYYKEYNGKVVKRNIFDGDKIFKNDDCIKLHKMFFGPLGNQLFVPEKIDILSPVCMKLYRSSIIMNNNLKFNDIKETGTYEDGLFNAKYFYYVKTAKFLDLPLYFYRKTNNESITTKYKDDLHIKWINIYNLLNENLNEYKIDDKEYRIAINNRKALSILGLGINIMQSNLSVIRKIREINVILEIYNDKKIYNSIDLKKMSIKWKLFYYFGREKIGVGIYIMLSFIQILRRFL